MFPLFSIDFYEKLDPTYLKRIQKLEEDLKAAEVNYNKRKDASFYAGGWGCDKKKLLLEFAEQYMMPKELWNIYFNERPVANHEPFKRLINLSHYHFYYNREKTNYAARKHRIYSKLLYRKIMDKSEPANFGDYSPEDFCYPHFEMHKRRNDYEEENCEFKASSLIPAKIIRRHEAMKKLYEKIKAAEGDEEKWIQVMLESNDVEFVEHKVEYKIGQDLTNKNLWKLYIKFLKEHDRKTLMQTYSKYIRFFMDDMDMKAEYQKAVAAKKRSHEVLWKNAYSMEKYVEMIKNPTQRLVNRKRKAKYEPKRNKLCFDPKNPKPQKFSFRPDLIDYILINATAHTLRTLFKTCKWFYIRNPATICYKFNFKNFDGLFGQKNWGTIHDHIVFDNRSIIVKNIYIATMLEICDIKPLYISQFVERIYRCEARHVNIQNQSLTTRELQCFIGHGNVAKLQLNTLTIADSATFALEDILMLTPKIENLSIHPFQSSPNTAKILAELPFQERIEHFSVTTNSLKPNAFAEFIKKNMAPKSRISVYFGKRSTDYFGFKKVIAETIKTFWKENERPHF